MPRVSPNPEFIGWISIWCVPTLNSSPQPPSRKPELRLVTPTSVSSVPTPVSSARSPSSQFRPSPLSSNWRPRLFQPRRQLRCPSRHFQFSSRQRTSLPTCIHYAVPAQPADVRRGFAPPVALPPKHGLCPSFGLWPTAVANEFHLDQPSAVHSRVAVVAKFLHSTTGIRLGIRLVALVPDYDEYSQLFAKT